MRGALRHALQSPGNEAPERVAHALALERPEHERDAERPEPRCIAVHASAETSATPSDASGANRLRDAQRTIRGRLPARAIGPGSGRPR